MRISVNLFSNILKKHPQFIGLQNSISSNSLPALVVGLSSIHKANFILASFISQNQSSLVITSEEPEAKRLVNDVNSMSDSEIALLFPARDFALKSTISAESNEYEQMRLNVLSKLSNPNKNYIVCASIDAVLQLTIPPEILKKNFFTLKMGNDYNISEISNILINSGYINRPQIEGVSQFSIRGGILDFFSPDLKAPIRAEFWGDTLDSMAYFDIDSQRRNDVIETVNICPASEILFESNQSLVNKLKDFVRSLSATKFNEQVINNINGDIERLSSNLELNSKDKYLNLAYKTPSSIFNYFNNPLIFISEFSEIKSRSKSVLYQHYEDIKALFEDKDLCKGIDKYYFEFLDISRFIEKNKSVYFDTFARSNPDLEFKSTININATSSSSWSGDIKVLYEYIYSNQDSNNSVIIFAGTSKAASTLSLDLKKDFRNVHYIEDAENIEPNSIYVIGGCLSAGLTYPDINLSVITKAKTSSSKTVAKKQRVGKEIRSLSDLSIGDLVVHISHGIGIFEGINKIDSQGIIKDYIKIKYAGSDVLYVPVTQLDLVSKYIGPKDDSKTKLNKLNSNVWAATKSRVRKAVADMAEELTKLYAERAKMKGYAFNQDNEWQKQFDDHFEYVETDDQLRCIREIKQDMQSTRPMERLLCGDVGFGKTEVALRGAFKCILDGKQVSILCPTTILAWQHYQTILKRMGTFPVNVELLSRYRTPKQQKEIIKKLKTGEIDIIVGTHRIIQKDIEFKDLGLAIIDEEQRFGVKHKESFKAMYRGIDILSLSATPIPRTLNMAMSGVRDMSVIEQAPQDRHPVQTYVIEHDYSIIREAIKKELRRAGQVFYVHNRIESIESCASKISEIVPEARIGIAHGRMDELALSKVWKSLVDCEIDVLICTTLIETGVDVPNCNTLIIEDADNMGLSQLYQLRGRVGRSSRRAFAYFTFKRGKSLSEISVRRLDAIREFTKFGSGFNIALRDLEIRGAGSILGGSQHGHMEAVGYDIYLKLLSEAVDAKKDGIEVKPTVECLIDVRLSAHIPNEYIENLATRIDVYKKIASIKSKNDSMDVLDELIDRFGEPPSSVEGLVEVALLRNIASKFGFVEIVGQGDSLMLYPQELDMSVANHLASNLRGRVLINAGSKPYIVVKLGNDNNVLNTIREIMLVLEKFVVL
jgi:transcription-repair coupling factor (superfamily II helicase)